MEIHCDLYWKLDFGRRCSLGETAAFRRRERCQETQNLVLILLSTCQVTLGEPVSFCTSNFPTINRRIPASFFNGEKELKRMSIFKHFERKILWDKGDCTVGSVWKDVKWQVTKFGLSEMTYVEFTGKTYKAMFCTSTHTYFFFFFFLNHMLLWDGNWDSGYYVSSLVLALPGRNFIFMTIVRLCWKIYLTRLAVGLIFLVSTFFSEVNLLTDSWAIFNLK